VGGTEAGEPNTWGAVGLGAMLRGTGIVLSAGVGSAWGGLFVLLAAVPRSTASAILPSEVGSLRRCGLDQQPASGGEKQPLQLQLHEDTAGGHTFDKPAVRFEVANHFRRGIEQQGALVSSSGPSMTARTIRPTGPEGR